MMHSTTVATSLPDLEMAQAGRFAQIRDPYAPRLRAMATAEPLQVTRAAGLDRHGPLSSVTKPVSEPAGVTVVRIPVSCERGTLTAIKQ